MNNTITFERLNSIYSDIEGIDVLVRLITDNVKRDEHYHSNILKLKNYVVIEVELYNNKIFATPSSDAKNRTIDEGDEYFKSLVTKLSKELSHRGMHQEAQEVSSYIVDDIETNTLPNKRMTEKQYVRSLRDSRIEYGLKCGMNKTNAKALSLVIEQLCFNIYD